MDTREIKIEIPKGYEIDSKNTTFTHIVFKKIEDNKVKNWDEYLDNWNQHKAPVYYADSDGNIRSFTPVLDRAWNHFDQVHETAAFTNLGMLLQLRKQWVDNWEPNWLDNSPKYTIETKGNCLNITVYTATSRSLSFPTKEMAKDFFDTFKNLLEKAKSLL